jgi:hypothetical protein
MPEFLQQIDIGTVTLIAVGCVVLCGVGFLLVFGLQIIGTLLGALSGFFEMGVGILAGGPVAWCGCGLFVMACLVCGGIALFVATAIPNCATNPVMFCRLLGY